MPKERSNRFATRWLTTTSAIVFGVMVVAACTHPSSQGSSPVAVQNTAPAPPLKIALNTEDMGTTSDLSKLSETLKNLFKERRAEHAYRVGMETRTDVAEEERLEKTVYILAEDSVKAAEFLKVVSAVHATGADPVQIPGAVEGLSLAGDRAQEPPRRGEKVRETRDVSLENIRPNPLLLLVAIGKPKRRLPYDGFDVSLNEVRTFDLSVSQEYTRVVIDVYLPQDNDYVVNGKHVEKSNLLAELKVRLAQTLPQRSTAGKTISVLIPDQASTSYASLLVLAEAAHKAGAEVLRLSRGEMALPEK